MPGIAALAMCSRTADSAPNEEDIMMFDLPNCAAVHSTTRAASDVSNIVLSDSRSSSVFSALVVCMADSGGGAGREPFNQFIKISPGNFSAVGRAQVGVFFVGAVKIAAAGLEQFVTLGELRAFLDPDCVVIAVQHFDAGQAQVDQAFHDGVELSVVFGAKLNWVGQHGQA